MKPAIWLSVALIVIVVLAWLSSVTPEILSQRLLIQKLTTMPDRHTPRFTNGTYLPPLITKNQTVPASASPVILTGATEIAVGTTLTIQAGTTLYANEFATLTINGSLISQGTPEKPVVFSTNEQNEANQVWNGLVFATGSHSQLSSTVIEYATPALSCLTHSSVTGTNVQLKNTKRPLFSEATHCL